MLSKRGSQLPGRELFVADAGLFALGRFAAGLPFAVCLLLFVCFLLFAFCCLLGIWFLLFGFCRYRVRMERLALPLFMQPLMVERVWGGNQLGKLFGKHLPPGKVIGESWELSDRVNAQTLVSGGPLDGATLGQVREQAPRALLGAQLAARKPKSFPLLAKFIDAGQDLSVQVHPDDAGCQRLGLPDRGKTECWVVLHATPGARIQRGLKAGVSRAGFEQALRDGKIEAVLHFFEVRAGDCIAIPPGTLHAIGAGIVLAEIQQNSDVTFRVYDYNRPGLDGKPRPLHLKEALETFCFERLAEGYFQGDMRPDTVAGARVNLGPRCRMTTLLKGRYFDLRRVELQSGAQVLPEREADTPALLMFLSGRGRLGGRAVQAGQTVLLPADLPRDTRALLATEGEAPLVWLESVPTPEA